MSKKFSNHCKNISSLIAIYRTDGVEDTDQKIKKQEGLCPAVLVQYLERNLQFLIPYCFFFVTYQGQTFAVRRFMLTSIFTFQLEIDDGKELTEEFLYDEIHPKRNLHRQAFAKPKGPPNRGAKRITKSQTAQ